MESTNIYKPEDELVALATKVSNLFKDLATSMSNNIPVGFFGTQDDKYKIVISNDHLEKDGAPLKSSARVNNETGEIILFKNRLYHPDITPDFIFYLIIWLDVIKTFPRDLIQADIITLQYYLSTGRSAKNMIKGLAVTVGMAGDDFGKVKRFAKLNEYIQNYAKNEVDLVKITRVGNFKDFNKE